MLSPQGLVGIAVPPPRQAVLPHFVFSSSLQESTSKKIYPELHQLVGGCLAKAPILNFSKLIARGQLPTMSLNQTQVLAYQITIESLEERTLLFPPRYRRCYV